MDTVYANRFQRDFIIFANEDGGFEDGAKPSGHVRLEIRGGKGKLDTVIHNLKDGKGRYRYWLYLIKLSGDRTDHVRIGEIMHTSGRAELRYEFSTHHAGGTSRIINEFDIAAVVVGYGDGPPDNIICPLAAYRKKVMGWRNGFRKALQAECEKTDCLQKTMSSPVYTPEKKQTLREGAAGSRSEQRPLSAEKVPGPQYPGTSDNGERGRHQSPPSVEHIKEEQSGAEQQLGSTAASNVRLEPVSESGRETGTVYEAKPENVPEPEREPARDAEAENAPGPELYASAGSTEISDLTGPVSYGDWEAEGGQDQEKSGEVSSLDLERINTGCVYLNGNLCGALINDRSNPDPCGSCRISRSGITEKAHSPGNLEGLERDLDQSFEVCDPFHSGRSDYKWWKVTNPVNLNNILYQNSIRSPLMFNPAVMMAHYRYKHLIIGIFTHKNGKRYVVCGVPGRYMADMKPFGEMNKWVQTQGTRPRYGAFGYWLIYIDPHDGKILNLNK